MRGIDRAVSIAEVRIRNGSPEQITSITSFVQGKDSCVDFWETNKIGEVREHILGALKTLHVIWTDSLRWEAFYPVANVEKKSKGTVMMF